eukprot:gene6738-4832_t
MYGRMPPTRGGYPPMPASYGSPAGFVPIPIPFPPTSVVSTVLPPTVPQPPQQAPQVEQRPTPSPPPPPPAYPSLSEQELFDMYCHYGVDLVRTVGRVISIAPTVIYQASVLLQQFQSAVQSTFRSRYKRSTAFFQHATSSFKGSAEEEAGRIEYIIPSNAYAPKESGILPLGDLFAPLDYCALSLDGSNDDVLYLAAACLFLSSKLLDNAPPLSRIVDMFVRISFSRVKVKASDSMVATRLDDFKSFVLQAEEQVAHTLGFRIGLIECPYKYLLCFLHFLIEDTEVNSPLAPGGWGGSNAGPPGIASSVRLPSNRRSEPYMAWLRTATSVLNDIPRSQSMLRYSNAALAVYAIHVSRPEVNPSITTALADPAAPPLVLPADWSACFGVTAEELGAMCRSAAEEGRRCKHSEDVERIVKGMGRPNYRDERKVLRDAEEERQRRLAPPPAPEEEPKATSDKEEEAGSAAPDTAANPSSTGEAHVLLTTAKAPVVSAPPALVPAPAPGSFPAPSADPVLQSGPLTGSAAEGDNDDDDIFLRRKRERDRLKAERKKSDKEKPKDKEKEKHANPPAAHQISPASSGPDKHKWREGTAKEAKHSGKDGDSGHKRRRSYSDERDDSRGRPRRNDISSRRERNRADQQGGRNDRGQRHERDDRRGGGGGGGGGGRHPRENEKASRDEHNRNNGPRRYDLNRKRNADRSIVVYRIHPFNAGKVNSLPGNFPETCLSH